MSNGLANAATKVGTEAFRSWGMLGAMVFVICFFLSGVFVYLDRERDREVNSAERRDVREGRLVGVMEKACTTLQQTSIEELNKNRVLLERLEQNATTWVPIIREVGDYLQDVRTGVREPRDERLRPGHRKTQP